MAMSNPWNTDINSADMAKFVVFDRRKYKIVNKREKNLKKTQQSHTQAAYINVCCSLAWVS